MSVSTLTRHRTQIPSISLDAELLAAANCMRWRDLAGMPVMQDSTLVGIVLRKDAEWMIRACHDAASLLKVSDAVTPAKIIDGMLVVDLFAPAAPRGNLHVWGCPDSRASEPIEQAS